MRWSTTLAFIFSTKISDSRINGEINKSQKSEALTLIGRVSIKELNKTCKQK